MPAKNCKKLSDEEKKIKRENMEENRYENMPLENKESLKESQKNYCKAKKLP